MVMKPCRAGRGSGSGTVAVRARYIRTTFYTLLNGANTSYTDSLALLLN